MPDDEWNRGYSAGYSARDRETRAMLSELRLVADALGVDDSDGGAVLRAVY